MFLLFIKRSNERVLKIIRLVGLFDGSVVQVGGRTYRILGSDGGAQRHVTNIIDSWLKESGWSEGIEIYLFCGGVKFFVHNPSTHILYDVVDDSVGLDYVPE